MDICVIGQPSTLGGAATELGDQIRCWQSMGVNVHVCPTMSLVADLKGCVRHASNDWASVAGMDVIAFCNEKFLSDLPEIRKHARTITWVNCMTWNFPKEIEHRDLIDLHLYQTQHGMDMVGVKLKTDRYRPMLFKPYFYADAFPFQDDRPQDRFRFGRLSRPDPVKFHKQQLWVYNKITSPRPKSGLVMGWDEKIRVKIPEPPDSDVACVCAGWMSAQDFYKFADALVMTTNTHENLPRVGFEAMSSGTVMVVDDRGGWRLQVESGRTGWLCANVNEMGYRASRLAHEPQEMLDMKVAARTKLERDWGLQASMDSWENVFKTIRSI